MKQTPSEKTSRSEAWLEVSHPMLRGPAVAAVDQRSMAHRMADRLPTGAQANPSWRQHPRPWSRARDRKSSGRTRRSRGTKRLPGTSWTGTHLRGSPTPSGDPIRSQIRWQLPESAIGWNVPKSAEIVCGGEGGIRTHGDFRLTCFQDRTVQPLRHLSAAEDTSGSRRLRRAAEPTRGRRTGGGPPGRRGRRRGAGTSRGSPRRSGQAPARCG
jgi:hypothetical protein